MSYERPSSRNEFEIAIICTLKSEYNALSLIFDEFWDAQGDSYGKAEGDDNYYTAGRVGNHNAILTRFPRMGKVNASKGTSSLRSSYTKVRLALLVGVCGGQPYGPNDEEIILGDVVISKAVIQYDFGRQYPDKFRHKDTIEDSLSRPNADISGMLAVIETDRGLDQMEERITFYLEEIKSGVRRQPRRYRYPGISEDKLFESSYRHKHHGMPPCICSECHADSELVCDDALNATCDDLGCHEKYLVPRERLDADEQPQQESNPAQQVMVHVGIFASGDAVIKSASYRDQLNKTTGAIGFEMEGAGVWEQLPCLVIKGVCDYADSHKNKRWQDYAAATAAAATKAILELHVRANKSTPDSRPDDNVRTSIAVPSGPTPPSPPSTNQRNEAQIQNERARLALKNIHVGDDGNQFGITNGSVDVTNASGGNRATQMFGDMSDSALSTLLTALTMPKREEENEKKIKKTEEHVFSQSGGGSSPTR